MKRTIMRRGVIVALACVLSACVTAPMQERRALDRVGHVIVIYAENRSFDHLYGMFPGANGISNATPEQYTQVDRDGKPFTELPPAWRGTNPDPTFTLRMPNRPFRLDQPPVNIPLSKLAPNPIHEFYRNAEQINGGRNDRFAAVSNAGGFTMGYYDGSVMKMWQWAKDYTLADNFFMGAYGGSYLNHQWLICACTPRVENAPANVRAQADDRGWVKRKPESPPSAMNGDIAAFDGQVTADGYSINTTEPPYQPSQVRPAKDGDPRMTDPARYTLPPQANRTIGDTLSAKGISWAWYAGAWNQAIQDGMQPPDAKRHIINNRDPGAPTFQTHHQPFNYYARFAPGTADRERHLKDYTDFVAALDKGDLPQVSFYKPQGSFTQHPGYSPVAQGDVHLAEVLERIRASPVWKDTVVIVTYDENGGFWDHVPPPKGDRWGPGTRIPAMIVSPFAKRGYIDHTMYDTTSILKFITRRFDLEPLPGVRAGVGDLTNALDLAAR